MPTTILRTHTCSFELRRFVESAPTSPPIHRWHLSITGSILSSAKWTCTSTTRSLCLRRILTVSRLRRYRTQLRRRIEAYSNHKPAVVQGHRRTHGCHNRGWWQYRSSLTTKVYSGESNRRDDGAVTRRPLPPRQISSQLCQCQDKLVRSKYAFSLMAGGQNLDYKVQIVDAMLFARKAVLSPTVKMVHI